MSLGDTYRDGRQRPDVAGGRRALRAVRHAVRDRRRQRAARRRISAPGAAASALTVGRRRQAGPLACFSSTGPLTDSGAMKPDLVAPGVDITAARSQDMTDGGTASTAPSAAPRWPRPHVAGAAAILAQQHPDWTGEQLKEQLMSSAKGLADGYSPFEIGTGRVDVAAAVTQHGARHRFALLRQLHVAARAERGPGHEGPDLHQHRRQTSR